MKTRNKGRDAIGDYYKTNRKIDKESREQQKKEGKKPFSRREKIMVVIAALLIISLCVKSIFLDEVRNLSPTESEFKVQAEEIIKKDKTNLLQYRIYDIGKDKGEYIAKVRGYLLWVIPIDSFQVKLEEDE